MKLLNRISSQVIALTIALFCCASLHAQQTPPAERTVKLYHYSADLSFNPYTQLLKGNVVYEISALRTKVDSIVLYAPGIDVSEVRLAVLQNNPQGIQTDLNLIAIKPVFKKLQDNLVIYPAQFITKALGNKPQYIITIKYSTLSPKELHLTGWDDNTGRMRKQVWAHRPFGWIPFMDQMCTQDITVTFDKNYQLVCNGERISKIASGDTAFTWHYRLDKPHPFYSVCLVAGDYNYRSITTAKGLPLELWYYPDQADRVDKTYELQKEMFDFFETQTGFPYPYKLYRNIPVADYLYGAMETTTSTVYADFMVVDKGASYGRTYLNTNAHELAHQWFGNCINDKTSDDLWLTESFATYFAKIFEQKYLGEDAYEYQRDLEFQKALKIAESNDFPLGSGKAGVERWYQKGSLVMDVMKDVLGDDAFKAGIAEYMNTNAFSEAESNDLLKAIYNTSGMALDWFFEEWIYKGGEPEYKVRWQMAEGRSEGKKIEVYVEQVQKMDKPEDLFKMPVNIDVYYKDGGYISKKVWIEKQSNIVEIPLDKGKEASYVVFDAGRRILKKMQFDRSFEELSAQLLGARFMPDRLEALRSLANTTVDKKRKVLKESYKKEKYFLIKEEIIAQLAGDSLSYDIMLLALKDKNARIRKAVADNIKIVPKSLLNEYEKLLNDSSYFIVETALVNLANTVRTDHPEQIDRYLDITKNMTGWRGRNIRTTWLGVALLKNTLDENYLKELSDYTTNSFDFETRLNAFNQLKKINYLNQALAQNLQKASQYWNYKLSNPTKDMITYFSQNEKIRWLLETKNP